MSALTRFRESTRLRKSRKLTTLLFSVTSVWHRLCILLSRTKVQSRSKEIGGPRRRTESGYETGQHTNRKKEVLSRKFDLSDIGIGFARRHRPRVDLRTDRNPRCRAEAARSGDQHDSQDRIDRQRNDSASDLAARVSATSH